MGTKRLERFLYEVFKIGLTGPSPAGEGPNVPMGAWAMIKCTMECKAAR